MGYCVSNHLANPVMALRVAHSNLQGQDSEVVSGVYRVQVRVFHAIY